jgi:NAD(P)-dependent dehydrogenase (short-subunit alcohol dehydrogenase family)
MTVLAESGEPAVGSASNAAMERLAGKIALVTGGGRGIGAASCSSSRARARDVAINYRRDREAAEKTADGGARARPARARPAGRRREL